MIHKQLPEQGLPEYHDRLLLVRLHADVKQSAVAAASMMSAAVPVAAAAFGAQAALLEETVSAVAPALNWMLRSGMVRRVTPFARRTTTGLTNVATALAASFIESAAVGQRALGGTNIVELEKGVDITDARCRIGNDAQVQFVSRVPMRYVAVAKRKATAKAAITTAAAPPATSLWNLKKIRWADARKAHGFKDADAVKVAVLDTGVDRTHPDLKKRVASYIYQHPDDVSVSGERDIVGHGTHVSGTIGAVIGNEIGVDGICSCDLRMWKIFTDQPEYIETFDAYMYVVDALMYHRALADCADEGVDVVNLSIGGPAPPDPQELQLFNTLTSSGAVVCAAMGNERTIGSPTSYPAAIQDVIAVGATSVNDAVASFSNRGDHIALAAPGKGIWSTLPTYDGQSGFSAVHLPDGNVKEGKPMRRERDYDSWDGTSMATPHVTAASALYIAKNGRSDGPAVKKALQKSADRVAGMGGKKFHPDYGSGRLNLTKLLS
jgi:subtilisin family serine protease